MAYMQAREPPQMSEHVAVRMENSIIVFGGFSNCEDGSIPLRSDEIWMYNLYTSQWGKYVIPDGEITPPLTRDPCAVIIKADIYMFGGLANRALQGWCCTNAVWKLTRIQKDTFLVQKNPKGAFCVE